MQKQFCLTALGNCHGLKFLNADCSLKNKFIVSFMILSFSVACAFLFQNTCQFIWSNPADMDISDGVAYFLKLSSIQLKLN